MFKLKEIKAAHLKVKSGVDFPNYIQDLIKLGVKKYSTYVNDGHTLFLGVDEYQIKSRPKYAKLNVANISDKNRFKHYLKNHQRGQTDYPTFCNNSAQTGVEKWTVDMEQMTCTYYDKLNNVMLVEPIRTP
ncbi:MAG TPA: DUF1398 family protein [Ferruginibacter sp.]|nr:DUF1398 family protein [Ferruginibacter sp.]